MYACLSQHHCNFNWLRNLEVFIKVKCAPREERPYICFLHRKASLQDSTASYNIKQCLSIFFFKEKGYISLGQPYSSIQKNRPILFVAVNPQVLHQFLFSLMQANGFNTPSVLTVRLVTNSCISTSSYLCQIVVDLMQDFIRPLTGLICSTIMLTLYKFQEPREIEVYRVRGKSLSL